MMNLDNLSRILAAREERVNSQRELLKNGGVLVSYTLNIPGPVKQAVLYRYVFDTGLERLRKALGTQTAEMKTGSNAAGFFAYLLLKNGENGSEKIFAQNIKEITVDLEEQEDLGRLFDMDVLYLEEGEPVKISRKQLGKPGRSCLVCDAPAFVCVRAMRHPVSEVLMKVVDRILASEEIQRKIMSAGKPVGSFAYSKGQKPCMDPIIREALRSILYEVITTPKPGLVDTENNGAHQDMNITTFFDSALTLVPYLEQCLETGRKAGKEASFMVPEALLPVLRPLGLEAEKKMYSVTGGVNTHKGVIFTFGILCAAIGWLSVRGRLCISKKAGDTYSKKTRTDRTALILDTAGKICSSLENGNPLFRREVLGGYPSVPKALDKLDLLDKEVTNLSGVETLLVLMSIAEDSNVLKRGGPEAACRLRAKAGVLMASFESRDPGFLKAVSEMDQELIGENCSPGGAADLLAVTYFLRLLLQKECFSEVL